MRKKAPDNSLLRIKDAQGHSVAGTLTCRFRHTKHMTTWARLQAGPSASECCSQGHTSKSLSPRSTGHSSWLQSTVICPQAPLSTRGHVHEDVRKLVQAQGQWLQKGQASLGPCLKSYRCDGWVTGSRHTEAEPGWEPRPSTSRSRGLLLHSTWADLQHDVIRGRSPQCGKE